MLFKFIVTPNVLVNYIVAIILSSEHDIIIKLIYLRRRYEILGEVGASYQVLSNLFKKRSEPEDHRIPRDQEGLSTQLSSDDVISGISEIQSFISDLPADYISLVNLFDDNERIKGLYRTSNNGYEKLQLTRILLDIEAIENSIIRKFINETYHIENEFIFQLDPSRFDLIPEYVVDECDKIIATM